MNPSLSLFSIVFKQGFRGITGIAADAAGVTF